MISSEDGLLFSTCESRCDLVKTVLNNIMFNFFVDLSTVERPLTSFEVLMALALTTIAKSMY